MIRPRGPLALLVLCVACGLSAACTSNPFDGNPSGEARPSPLPYGYHEPQGKVTRPTPASEGEELDEIMAVVWGEVLTRRRLIRETGGQKEGEDPVAFERDIRRRRLEWAKEQLLVKAAEQEGLRLIPSVLDEALVQEKERLAKEASLNTGRPVTFEEVLAQQNLSEEEFRTSIKNRVLRQYYMRKLMIGLGKGARPQVDVSVSPAEVRRLYREQPELFDEKPGVKLALFQFDKIAEYDKLRELEEGITPIQAEERTHKKIEELAAAFRAGGDPRELAKRYGLDDRRWKLFDQFVDKFAIKRGAAWLFAPERKPRDADVFQFDEVPAGPVVLGILDVRPAKKRTFEESYDDVVRVYRVGREMRLESQKVIELVQGGSVVWPATLADDLVDEARARLREIEADERLSRARFR